MKAYTDNAADRRQLDKRERIAKRNQSQLESDYRTILGSPVGRRVLWSIVELLQPAGPLWAGNSECQRNAVMYDDSRKVLQQFEAVDQNAVFLMWQEAKATERRDQLEMEGVSVKGNDEKDDD